MMRRGAWIGLVLACLVVAALGNQGCSKKVTPPLGNQAPHTWVFLQGPVDTMSYRVRLHWYGTDTDGDVVGYEIQFTSIGQQPVASAWSYVTVVDSVFALPIPSGAAGFTFWVRAVDNAGLRDPDPAHEDLYLRNNPPSVAFYNRPHLNHSAGYHFLPVLTLQWKGSDPEGESTIDHYHLWLDGGAAAGAFDTTLSPGDTVFTLRMENLGDVTQTRVHTAYISVVDEAQAVGNTDTLSWQVDAVNFPASGPRVLLVDDFNADPSVPKDNLPIDSLYRNAVGALTAGKYTLYETFVTDNFRFPADAAELFRHFDMIVWYNENGGIPTDLQVCGDAMAGFLQRGGHLFLSAESMVGPAQALADDWNAAYLGVQQTFCYHDTPPVVCRYTINRAMTLLSGNPAAPNDQMSVTKGFDGGAVFFQPTDSTVTEFYVPYWLAGDDTTEDGYIKANRVCAVTRTVQGGGRTTFVSFAMGQYQSTNRVAVLQRLLTSLYTGAHLNAPRFFAHPSRAAAGARVAADARANRAAVPARFMTSQRAAGRGR